MKNIKEWFQGLSVKNRNLVILLAIISVLYIIHHIYFLPNATGLKLFQQQVAKERMTEEQKQQAQSMKLEDDEKAIRIYLEEVTAKEDYKSMYQAQLALANLAYDREDYEVAIAEFEKVVTLADKAEDDSKVVPILNEIGSLHIRLGNINQAHESFKRAHVLNLEKGDKSSIAKSYHNLGQITYLLGDFAAANKHYAEAIKLHKELKEHLSVAASYDALAELYARGGEYKDAADFQVLAINQYIIKDHKPGILLSYVALGQIYELLKDPVTSCRSWKEALPMVTDLNIHVAGDRSQLKNLITDKLAADFCQNTESGFGRGSSSNELPLVDEKDEGGVAPVPEDAISE